MVAGGKATADVESYTWPAPVLVQKEKIRKQRFEEGLDKTCHCLGGEKAESTRLL